MRVCYASVSLIDDDRCSAPMARPPGRSMAGGRSPLTLDARSRLYIDSDDKLVRELLRRSRQGTDDVRQ